MYNPISILLNTFTFYFFNPGLAIKGLIKIRNWQKQNMNIEKWDIIKWHTSLYGTPKKQRQTCLFEVNDATYNKI